MRKSSIQLYKLILLFGLIIAIFATGIHTLISAFNGSDSHVFYQGILVFIGLIILYYLLQTHMIMRLKKFDPATYNFIIDPEKM